MEDKLIVEKVDAQYAINKMNDNLDTIRKIKAYIGHLGDVVNKAKLFDNNLAMYPITVVKVIAVLVYFNQKMEELLDNMQSLFKRLEATQSLLLEMVPNISMDMEEILSLQAWGVGAIETTPMPTKQDQLWASKPMKDTQEVLDKPECKPEGQAEVPPHSDLQPTPLKSTCSL